MLSKRKKKTVNKIFSINYLVRGLTFWYATLGLQVFIIRLCLDEFVPTAEWGYEVHFTYLFLF